MPRDGPTGSREALRGRERGREAIDDAVVEADEREVRLGDREILVVARVRDDRLPAGRGRRSRASRQVEPVLAGDAFERHGAPHL